MATEVVKCPSCYCAIEVVMSIGAYPATSVASAPTAVSGGSVLIAITPVMRQAARVLVERHKHNSSTNASRISAIKDLRAIFQAERLGLAQAKELVDAEW